MLLFPVGSGFLNARSMAVSQKAITGSAMIKGIASKGVVISQFTLHITSPQTAIEKQICNCDAFLITMRLLPVLYTMG